MEAACLTSSLVLVLMLCACFLRTAITVPITTAPPPPSIFVQPEDGGAETAIVEDNEAAEELANQFEGDILGNYLLSRNAIADKSRRWTGNVVPYILDARYSDYGKLLIRRAMQAIADATSSGGNACITFVERTLEADYISVEPLSGCYSYVGRISGKQVVSIGSGCAGQGTMIHEFLHALGFWHEQSRTDRDNYVKIHWDNIPESRMINFQKFNRPFLDDMGQPYDYDSVLHYSGTAFAIDRSKPTITPKVSGATIGQRNGLSRADVKEVRLLYECTVDGGWSDWSSWTCSVTCGTGTASRFRSCTNPAPLNQGASCIGVSSETQLCNNEAGCPVDGGWSGWSSWTCSVTCGTGIATRDRTCTQPAPQNQGADCVGVSAEMQQCNVVGCPVAGGWTGWTYSPCSVTCGAGTATRVRSCTEPAPANQGADCIGLSTDTRECTESGCPVDGGWSDWSLWTCSVNCGTGTATRDRTCTKPIPQHEGAECIGVSTETQQCNASACPVNDEGTWSDWSSWTCSVTCGTGTASRVRTCTDQAELNQEGDCVGVSTENQQCTEAGCPVDGGWSDWGSWTCSVACGPGTATRVRTCTKPAPENQGADCVGVSAETRQCNEIKCPDLPSCTFQYGKCGWTNDPSLSLPWVSHRWKTWSYFTGPSNDHTGSTANYYMYVEASFNSYKVARFLSPLIQPGSYCFKYYYHMYGASMGRLSVFLRNGNNGQIDQSYPTVQGNQGTLWHETSINILETNTFRVVFEARIGNGYRSDIAIDDVQFTTGNC